jgi:hypothetical protein
MPPARPRRFRPVRPDVTVSSPLAAAAHLHLWATR